MAFSLRWPGFNLSGTLKLLFVQVANLDGRVGIIPQSFLMVIYIFSFLLKLDHLVLSSSQQRLGFRCDNIQGLEILLDIAF